MKKYGKILYCMGVCPDGFGSLQSAKTRGKGPGQRNYSPDRPLVFYFEKRLDVIV